METNKLSVSVAMATYNGGKYIREQLDSILKNLNLDIDEIIISDDGSKDDTLEIIEEYCSKYKNIVLLKNQNRHGVIGNFENAINHTSKDVIFLSDQDDIWMENKVEKVLANFDKTNALLAIHNANIYLSNECKISETSMKEKLGFSTNIIKVIIKNPYIGCCMAFKKDLKNVILPFPEDKLMNIHDWWIALCALKVSNAIYIDDKLINYRIHDSNTLGFHKTTLSFKITKRVNMIRCLHKNRRRFKK